jgi:acetolactate synthase-1/2/3 large subunit
MLNKLRLSGAEALVRALVESGVEVVFGIPGVHNLALFEALRRSGIRVVAATHEQGAAFMANGYGRATGRPGVFVSVPGPGLTNSLTPVAEALVDSSPLLGIVTDVPQSPHAFQMHEIRQTSLAGPVAKSVKTVQYASEIASVLKQLYVCTTSGEPGPCILHIPSNLYWEKVDAPAVQPSQVESTTHLKEIDAVVDRLKSAKQVGLFAGMGAADAAEEVCALAEWLDAPVATTGSGRGVLDEAHPLSLGFAWRNGSSDVVNRIFEKCDLVLAIGVKFSQNGTLEYSLKIPCPMIHVDASPDVMGRNYQAEMTICMDARQFLRSVLEKKSVIGKRRSTEMFETIRAEKEVCETGLKNDTSTKLFLGNHTISPWEFFTKLRGLVPPDGIVVTDAGYNERLTIRNWVVREPRTLINPSNFESMGFGIPTAIGAAIACPGRKVIAVVGDGGLVMSGLEIMTAIREKLNLTVIVLNNNGFGIIKRIQQDFFGATVAVDVGAPDIKAFAESIHMDFQSSEGGLSALEDTVKRNSPVLLEVKMQHREPPAAEQLKKRLKNDVKQELQIFTRR